MVIVELVAIVVGVAIGTIVVAEPERMTVVGTNPKYNY
jgi:hypothetical protein